MSYFCYLFIKKAVRQRCQTALWQRLINSASSIKEQINLSRFLSWKSRKEVLSGAFTSKACLTYALARILTCFFCCAFPQKLISCSDILQQKWRCLWCGYAKKKLTAAGLLGTCTRFHAQSAHKGTAFFEIVQASIHYLVVAEVVWQ